MTRRREPPALLDCSFGDRILFASIAAAPAAVPSSGASRSGWHRLKDLQTCMRYFAVHHVEGLEPPRTKPAFAKGALFHLGAMHHYGRMAGFGWARDPVEAMREAPEKMVYVFDEVQAMYRHYAGVYRREPFRVLDVEREFGVRIRGHVLTARLDLVVEDGGTAKIVEHKTSAELKSPREWLRDGQILGQIVIARATFEGIYGKPFGGLIVNQVRTGPIRDVRRTPVEPTEEALAAWPRSVLHWLETAVALREKYGDDAWKWPEEHGSCIGRYGPCELYDACNEGRWLIADWVKKEAFV